MNKKISFIPAILIIIPVAIIAGVVVVLMSLQMRDAVKVSSYEKQKETQDETADWKTYRNEEYGFEVKYPNNWYIKDKDQFKTYCWEEHCLESVSIENSDEVMVVETPAFISSIHAFFWIAIYDDDLLSKQKDNPELINIGGKEIEAYVSEGTLYKSISFNYNEKRYRISYEAGKEEFVNILGKILSTFRFID